MTQWPLLFRPSHTLTLEWTAPFGSLPQCSSLLRVVETDITLHISARPASAHFAVIMESADGLPKDTHDSLSTRGRAALEPRPEYLRVAFSAWSDQYDARTNPEGFVDLSVAENRLSLPLVAEALNRAPPVPAEFLTYDIMSGSERTRNAVAAFFSRLITKTPVKATDLVLSAGAGSTIDLLTTVLCDPGDKVLITAPAYRSFQQDVGMRARAICVAAPLDKDSEFQISVEALEGAWAGHGGDQSGIRVVLLSSPNNPTGEVLRRSTICDIVRWTRKHEMHLVMDEVYALSVFSSDAEFVSVANVLEGELGDHVHIVWSFSKDFCLSGCRIGLLYTQNKAVLAAVDALSYFASTSRHTQWALIHMLENLDWVQEYVLEHKARLATAYEHASQLFKEMGAPHIRSHAGFFMLVDLRRWMSADSSEAEEKLWRRLVDSKVLLTPGGQMLSSDYGWFRCCFSAMDESAVRIGVDRIQKALQDA
jgi:1-aminocyclopropane-1-carboxylate synthase 1/2/6